MYPPSPIFRHVEHAPIKFTDPFPHNTSVYPQIFDCFPNFPYFIRFCITTNCIPHTNIQNIGGAADAKRMSEVVSFYKKLPTGPAPAPKKPSTPWGKYKAAYFDGNNASGKPLLHLAALVLISGYIWEYQSHLKHHKH